MTAGSAGRVRRGLSVGALGAAILLAACTGSSGHASNQPGQPPSPTAPPTPSPTPLSVAAYFRAVDALLTRSAALRPRIVAAEAAAEGGDQQALQAAHGTLIRALLSHQISLATVQSLQAPSEARAVNGQLATALQATATADRADLNWVNVRIVQKPKGTVKRARAAALLAEERAAAARAAFFTRYDALRGAAGVAPFPARLRF